MSRETSKNKMVPVKEKAQSILWLAQTKSVTMVQYNYSIQEGSTVETNYLGVALGECQSATAMRRWTGKLCGITNLRLHLCQSIIGNLHRRLSRLHM